MPTYTYYCEECKKEFEELHSITTQLEECPFCHAKTPKRLISATNFVLVGSGWARDNYS